MWWLRSLAIFVGWIESFLAGYSTYLSISVGPSKMDWVLVELLFKFSNQKDLQLAEIVQNLHAQGFAVLSIEPVMNPKQLVSFLKKINHLNHGRRRELVGCNIPFHDT